MKTEQVSEIGTVFSTREYGIIKMMHGNRMPNPVQVERIKSSMINDGISLIPIVVNNSMEIVDGQHRYLALKSLGEPIDYIIKDGWTLKDAHINNDVRQGWNMDQWMQSYIDYDVKEYSEYKEFMDYYGFSHSACLTLLCINRSSFVSGTILLDRLDIAYNYADKIQAIGVHYDGYKSLGFVKTMVFMLNNKDFDYERLMRKKTKIELYMKGCRDIADFKFKIEELYNSRETPKKYLR